MRDAETILAIIRDRGSRGLPIEDLYRQLFNPALYLMAYNKLYRNKGAMTPGATQETVDGMDLNKIQGIIEALKYERYQWTPVRRTYIPKSNGKLRPLGIPTWSDKLLQEVVRMLLEAYYEPQFSPRSHGFRPGRGCHTALVDIRHHWKGTAWFIEGDISKCFDTLDHEVLISILRETIHDNRFLRLLQNLLQAGYLEEWNYHKTYSGSPQGGVVSPILSNIYLDRLDKFVEETLLPRWNQRDKRSLNPEYRKLAWQIWKARQQGRVDDARSLKAEMQQLPAISPTGPDYRRLRYVRYADDFLLGFIGSRTEAEEIKGQLKEFLRDQLKLELSEAKTLVTHARTEAARFLGYEIVTLHDDTKMEPGYRHRRVINGAIGLKVPSDVIKAKSAKYMKHGKPIHLPERLNDTAFSIVALYQSEYRGVVQYYQLAYNLCSLDHLKWVMEQSLTKTLAAKLRITGRQVWKRHQTTIETKDGPRKVLQVTVGRDGKEPLVATWGGISLKWKKEAVLDDNPATVWNMGRSELLERLLADECELCGSKEGVQVHHIRALKDLMKPGKRAKSAWEKDMIARNRKSLVVCLKCHRTEIHPGKYDGTSL